MRQVESGTVLVDGVCYVHPAAVPLDLIKEDGRLILKIVSEHPSNEALDHFLISASKAMGANLLAVLLSGGPSRGLEGLRAVKRARGMTMVQDPVSSVDPRMAETALLDRVVDRKCPADSLAETFLKLIKQPVLGSHSAPGTGDIL